MIAYVGEHLWLGNLGNFFVISSFVCALSAAFCYFLVVKNELQNQSWKKLARLFFRLHSFSVIGIVIVLFTMLFNHMFEFHYVWQHSNRAMDLKFIMSCFWEGQEGSFLLWTFWNIVLGNILIRTTRDWEAPVMVTVAMVQVFLASMLLGIYLVDYKLGSNPFTVLTREHPDFANAPFTKMPNYLEKLDGRGLNPLLQNYWMTIHPPTLFLGFASTLVPFAFAIAGLWIRRYNDWQKPALPWAFFSIMILGTGILMGGAWAYEALSFGGFWAWDPVENSSLVPWLTMVGGAHVMLVNKNKGQSLFSTFFLIISSFLLVLYSTFLTRSGILGNSSVHAFTDLGMSGQLLIYLAFFVFMAAYLLAINYKHFPKETQEESIWSRDFWMFIGALILLLAAFQIIFTTSFPVINKLFGTNMAVGAGDAIKHYNKWQIPFAIVILLLIAGGQFLKYKQTNPKEFIKRISVSFFIALTVSLIAGWALNWYVLNSSLLYFIMLFAGIFAVIANADYAIRIIKGKLDFAGASIAHIGFALLLLGALISTSKSEVISETTKYDVEFLGKDFSNRENTMLVKNDTIRMGEYYVSYRGKKHEGINVLFEVDYLKKDTVTGTYTKQFTLNPFIQRNERMGNAPEPDTRHFWNKDIYSHVRYADLSNLKTQDNSEYGPPQNNTVSVGDTMYAYNGIMVLEGLETRLDTAKYHLGKPTVAVGAKIKVFDFYKNERYIMPIYAIYDSIPKVIEAGLDDLGIKVALWQINPSNGKVDISIKERKTNKNDFIVMKAVVFPFINVLWLGCIIMVIGTVMAIRHRLKRK